MDNTETLKTLSEYLTTTEEMLSKRGGAPEMSVNSMPELNRKLWGLRKQEIVIIGARTSNGKSAFATQIGWDCAVNFHKVLYLSIEMPVERVLERLFCTLHKVDNYELLRGGFKKDKYQEEWKQFKVLVKSRPIVFCDYIGKTWKEVDRAIELLKDKPDVVIIDHIHHIRSSGGMSDKQQIDDYLEHFREMAIRYKFCGILCAQINRVSAEDKSGEPQLYHLKSTGKLEEIADVALLLSWPWHSDNKKDKNLYKVNVAKNRYGSTGRFDLKFEPEYYLFSGSTESKPEAKVKSKGWQDD